MGVAIFKLPDGKDVSVEVPNGESLMQAASNAGIAGIIAECGGSAMCATCHVYVDGQWLDSLSAPLANELEMLDCTLSPRLANSRLSCQIRMTLELSGINVTVPDAQ